MPDTKPLGRIIKEILYEFTLSADEAYEAAAAAVVKAHEERKWRLVVGHGTCCICPDCGKHHEDCECSEAPSA